MLPLQSYFYSRHINLKMSENINRFVYSEEQEDFG